MSHLVQHRPAQVRPRLDELASTATEVGDGGLQAWAAHAVATVAASDGAFDEAREAYGRCVDWARRTGDPVRESYGVGGLTAVALTTGRWADIPRPADGMGRSGRTVEPVVHAGFIPALREIATLADRGAHAAAAIARTGEFFIGAVDPVSG